MTVAVFVIRYRSSPPHSSTDHSSPSASLFRTLTVPPLLVIGPSRGPIGRTVFFKELIKRTISSLAVGDGLRVGPIEQRPREMCDTELAALRDASVDRWFWGRDRGRCVASFSSSRSAHLLWGWPSLKSPEKQREFSALVFRLIYFWNKKY